MEKFVSIQRETIDLYIIAILAMDGSSLSSFGYISENELDQMDQLFDLSSHNYSSQV